MCVQHHSCGTHPLDTSLQEGEIGGTYIRKGMILMLHLHAPDVRELIPCPRVSLQCVTRFRQILWRRSGTMGDRSCRLLGMPLPDFVIVLTFVLGVKFGSSAQWMK